MGAFLYQHPDDNVVSLASTITVSAPDAAYPSANLSDGNPARPCKFDATSGTIVFDFGAARRIDLAALIHHNLDAGLNVRIQANATDAWGGPSLNEPFTIPAIDEDGFSVNPWFDLTGAAGYLVGGYRYWRLAVIGANAANVAIGQLWLGGEKRQATHNFSWEYTETDDHPLIEHRTDLLVSTMYDLGTRARRLDVEIETSDAGIASLRAWIRAAAGRARPVLVVPDPALNDAWLVRVADPQFSIGRRWNNDNVWQVSWQEVSRGLPL